MYLSQYRLHTPSLSSHYLLLIIYLSFLLSNGRYHSLTYSPFIYSSYESPHALPNVSLDIIETNY